MTYQNFMARLASRNGSLKKTQARKRWDGLSFTTSGKVTVKKLFKFEVEFREALQGLPNLSEEEKYRHLLAKMPQNLSGWVIDEETRLKCSQPQILMDLPGDYNEQVVQECVRKIVVFLPTQIMKIKTGQFLITFMSWQNAQKMLDIHGKKKIEKCCSTFECPRSPTKIHCGPSF